MTTTIVQPSTWMKITCSLTVPKLVYLATTSAWFLSKVPMMCLLIIPGILGLSVSRCSVATTRSLMPAVSTKAIRKIFKLALVQRTQMIKSDGATFSTMTKSKKTMRRSLKSRRSFWSSLWFWSWQSWATSYTSDNVRATNRAWIATISTECLSCNSTTRTSQRRALSKTKSAWIEKTMTMIFEKISQ